MENPEKTIGLAAHELERRGMPRCLVDEEAALLVVGHGSAIGGRMMDLSASGCRLALKEALPQGIHAAVEVSFRIHGIAFRLRGLTEWTSGGRAVGVSFGPMSPRRRDELLEVLREVDAEQAVKRAKAAGSSTEAGCEPPAANRNGESFRLLNVVFRKAPNGGAPAEAEKPTQMSRTVGPAPAAGNPCAEGGPARRERRVEARCGVDTSAVIHLVKVGSRLAGLIRDLSLGGCRIHTTEKFPVGIYTRVEVEFRLQGTALLLGGVVQAIHGRNEVGIRFLDVSSRKRENVAELIREIRETQGESESSAG
jgi:c-di-GMP-binding flagellar brake protein YcgR